MTQRRPQNTRTRRPSPSERTEATEQAVRKGVLVGPPQHPKTLNKRANALLAEALRRAEEARTSIEAAFVGFGRWLLVNVFDDDANAALAPRSDNVVWSELVARAGGPTLRMSRKMLYVALAIAARDKHITDESWRLLEPGRKELLLPLADETLMRKAAQHVVSMKLSQKSTREYVRELLASRGHEALIRMGPKRAQQVIARMVDPLADHRFRARLREQIGGLKGRERAATRKALEELSAAVRELLADLRRE